MRFSFDALIHATTENWLGLFVSGQRVFILYLLTAAIMAWLVWKADRDEGSKGFLAWLLPAGIYNHRSAWQDYFIFLGNGLIYYGLIAQFLFSERPFAALVHDAVVSAFGELPQPVLQGTPAVALYTLAVILLYDFAIFLMHYWTHKFASLWAFHKVHHSAEVLTPVTLFRMHPVDLALNAALAAVFTGAGIGIFAYLSHTELTDIRVLGINVVLFGFYFFGYNLRHSHVWLHYPRWLSAIFISPAQHQIHHSVETRHIDRNFGLIFSFWDRLFGTLYVPPEREEFPLGVTRKNRNPYATTLSMYLTPFAEAWTVLTSARTAGGALLGRLGFALGLAGAVFAYMWLIPLAQAMIVTPPSVHTEELTWTEIRRAQDNGYDTIIIPVGGTEQNGPHMVTGKHNYIVRYTAQQIAQRLGKTLVAPVVAYVPEGEPKAGQNMAWTGTIGVPPSVLEDNLYWAAHSFAQHGFKRIFFIGDHAYDQPPQERAAARLMRGQGKNGNKTLAASLTGYYDAGKAQIDWLHAQGFSDAQIGAHAGIRDTSEMMFVRPQGLRTHAVTIKGGPDGVWGQPQHASAEIGRQMLQIKIDAALAAIAQLERKAAP